MGASGGQKGSVLGCSWEAQYYAVYSEVSPIIISVAYFQGSVDMLAAYEPSPMHVLLAISF